MLAHRRMCQHGQVKEDTSLMTSPVDLSPLLFQPMLTARHREVVAVVEVVEVDPREANHYLQTSSWP